MLFPATQLYNDTAPSPDTVKAGLVWTLFPVFTYERQIFPTYKLVVLEDPEKLKKEWDQAREAVNLATFVSNCDEVLNRYGFILVGLGNVDPTEAQLWWKARLELTKPTTEGQEHTRERAGK